MVDAHHQSSNQTGMTKKTIGMYQGRGSQLVRAPGKPPQSNQG